MDVFVEVDYERHLRREPHDAQVHKPPSIVGFNAPPGPRSEQSTGGDGVRGSMVADEGAADQSCQLILFLGAGRRDQARQQHQNRN